MQRFIIKKYPHFETEQVEGGNEDVFLNLKEVFFLRGLNSILDGGKIGIDLGLAIIPGALIISTFVMILTFGPSAEGYTGSAYKEIALLPPTLQEKSILFSNGYSGSRILS